MPPRPHLPRTLLARTFVLVSLLIFISVATWLTLFSLAQSEPRARHIAQLAVSAVNLTEAALVAADPLKRQTLLQDLAESEGVHLYPSEPTDTVVAVPDTQFYDQMLAIAREQLGPNTRLAKSVNRQSGLWIGFDIDGSGEDEYWLRLPAERVENEFPWFWVNCGLASFAFALLVAWLIVSRVTKPLRALAAAADDLGRGLHPEPISEDGAFEFHQLAAAFNRMSADIKRMNTERAEVLAGISHDLRTPLARLRLESELSITDNQARDAVISDIEQMDAIITQFLDYAKGEGAETTELADINTLVGHAAGRQSRHAASIDFCFTELPRTRVYPNALGRAIANLMENARKYAGTGIRVETSFVGHEIRIDILDRGPGIPTNQIEHLKRPFTRLDDARTDATGTGLGLAIVERIAHLHNGHLDLLPRNGGGLIARLRIPLND